MKMFCEGIRKEPVVETMNLFLGSVGSKRGLGPLIMTQAPLSPHNNMIIILVFIEQFNINS